MKITDISPDEEHQRALDATNYWGHAGAGAIIFARETGRFLFIRRSAEVREPHTWSGAGGAIDPDENPEQAVVREIGEELGYNSPVSLSLCMTYNDQTFRYYNFIGVVEKEFTPVLNWENEGHIWVNYGEWPQPLHFGMQAVFANSSAVEHIRDVING